MRITANELSACTHTHNSLLSPGLCMYCSLCLDHPPVFFNKPNHFLSLQTPHSSFPLLQCEDKKISLAYLQKKKRNV